MLVGLVIVATFAIGQPALGGDGATCYSDWSIAAPLVKKEGLATVETLTSMARAKLGGDIVNTSLCEDNGRFFYRLVVRNEKGQLRTLAVDARAPFGR